MKKLLTVMILLVTSGSFASNNSHKLVLESCDVKSHSVQLNLVTRASDKLIEETLIKKGYHFNQSIDSNALDISIIKDYGQTNNQSEQGKEPSAIDSIVSVIGGVISSFAPVKYSEQREISSNGKTIFSLSKDLSTYSYGDSESIRKDIVEALNSLPDCVEN